jgi:hypothetical protein
MRAPKRMDYTLHLMTADGGSRIGGTFPTADLAETLGRALRDFGSCVAYDVVPTDW